MGLTSLRSLEFSPRLGRDGVPISVNIQRWTRIFQMDDVFDSSLIKNPSHCPVPNPYPSILLYEMQLRKVTVHIKFTSSVLRGSVKLMAVVFVLRLMSL
jgi:hypothetical protein